MGTELEDLKVESKSDGKKGEGKAGLIVGMGEGEGDFSFNLFTQLIKNNFYMSSHSHRRVEPNSQKSSKFSSKYSSQSQNLLGTVIQEDKNY